MLPCTECGIVRIMRREIELVLEHSGAEPGEEVLKGGDKEQSILYLAKCHIDYLGT